MGYNKNNFIERYSNSDFETLRNRLQRLINDRKGITGPGDSNFNLYTAPANIETSITATQQQVNMRIDTSPFVNGIKTIQDLLKKGYMKPMGTSTQIAAAQSIKDSDVLDQYSIIPALTDFYTVVNYWRDGNNESNHNGCNGACVGYCTGSCANQAKIGNNRSDNQSGAKFCTDGSCSTACSEGCLESCYTECISGCTGTCYSTCGASCGSCASTCGQECNAHCGGDCSAACGIAVCDSTCDGACTGCDDDCSSGCGSGCTGACFQNCSGGTGPTPA